MKFSSLCVCVQPVTVVLDLPLRGKQALGYRVLCHHCCFRWYGSASFLCQKCVHHYQLNHICLVQFSVKLSGLLIVHSVLSTLSWFGHSQQAAVVNEKDLKT